MSVLVDLTTPVITGDDSTYSVTLQVTELWGQQNKLCLFNKEVVQ